MRETIEAAGRRVLRDWKHYQDRLPIAIGTGAPSSAEDAFGVLPQHLGANIAIPDEPGGWAHAKPQVLTKAGIAVAINTKVSRLSLLPRVEALIPFFLRPRRWRATYGKAGNIVLPPPNSTEFLPGHFMGIEALRHPPLRPNPSENPFLSESADLSVGRPNLNPAPASNFDLFKR
jgi:hypothetical protein